MPPQPWVHLYINFPISTVTNKTALQVFYIQLCYFGPLWGFCCIWQKYRGMRRQSRTTHWWAVMRSWQFQVFWHKKISFVLFMSMLCLRPKESTHSNGFSLWKTKLKQHMLTCHTSRRSVFGGIIHSSSHTKNVATSKVTSLRWTWPTYYNNCSSYHTVLH